jgi:adenylate kinase
MLRISLTSVLFVLLATNAFAYSREVRSACRDDYYAHCSMHPTGSAELRSCMRKVGKSLAPGCIQALKASGEVAKEGRRQKRKRHS